MGVGSQACTQMVHFLADLQCRTCRGPFIQHVHSQAGHTRDCLLIGGITRIHQQVKIQQRNRTPSRQKDLEPIGKCGSADLGKVGLGRTSRLRELGTIHIASRCFEIGERVNFKMYTPSESH